MKIILTILSLASVLLVAGCSAPGFDMGGGSAIVGRGLEILSFSAEPSTAYSGAGVRLTMELENKGGHTVPSAQSMIFLTGTNFNKWGGTSGKTYNSLGVDMKTDDIVRNVPANTKKITWSLTAPQLTAGQTETDTFIARVYSEYQTSINGNIWAYSEAEADAARTSGRSLYAPSFTQTAGPIGLSISMNPNPLVLYSGERTFSLSIRISNSGSGTIYYPGSVSYTGSQSVKIPSENMNRVKLAVIVDGASVADCESNQELIDGKDTTAVCTVTLSKAVDTFESHAVNIVASYGYFTERMATVTVQGKGTTSSTGSSSSSTSGSASSSGSTSAGTTTDSSSTSGSSQTPASTDCTSQGGYCTDASYCGAYPIPGYSECGDSQVCCVG